MNKSKYLDDISEIREIMEKSSRFISLSGLSGISAGITALIGAFIAYQTVYDKQDYFTYRQATLSESTILELLGIAVITLTVATVSGIYFTQRKAKRSGHKIWSIHVKRLLINLAIPLISGGVLCLVLLSKGYVALVAPLTLIFYGLALVNASKYTMNEIRSLGIVQILLGLIATIFIGYGLAFWALGFGVIHILYGAFMHIKYK